MYGNGIYPHVRAVLAGQFRQIEASTRSKGKLASDLDTPSFRASYRRSNGLLVAGMIVAVAGLGFFSGTLAAGASRGSDDVAPLSVCIAPTAPVAATTQEDSTAWDFSHVFTAD